MKIKWEVNTCNYLEYYLKNAKFSKDTRGHDDDNDGDGKQFKVNFQHLLTLNLEVILVVYNISIMFRFVLLFKLCLLTIISKWILEAS